ncbi:MAG: type III pantothenate kinase [Candidatus Omnitrophica bacterium]|nr:type III pantothenate kinase [Candidatus Omnitrophota bacterium]
MLLLIDLGNTCIKIGFKDRRENYRQWNMSSLLLKDFPRFKAGMNKGNKKFNINKVEVIVYCSVVPAFDSILENYLKIIYPKTKIFKLGDDIDIPVKNLYSHPKQVGKDRLANAVAAKYFYKLPAVIVDFGTAITIDVVSGAGAYLGGIIVPGIGMSLAGLYEKTALLPKIEQCHQPAKILGTNTKNSILSGIYYGTGFLIDGFIKAFETIVKNKATVIATGGNLDLVRTISKKITDFDLYLTLKGIEKSYLTSKK